MNRVGRQVGLLTVAAGLLLTCMASGQPDTNAPPASPPNRVIPAHLQRKSPVAFFRELLDMSPAKREQFLSNHRPEIRKRIEAKLEEYESLAPGERELRLRTTELYWYLRPLMSIPRNDRAQRLAQVPVDLRQLVEDRLDLWDMTPPSLKEELIENEIAVRYFTRTEPNLPPREGPSPRRRQFEEGIHRWQNMSPDQRRMIEDHFNQYFALTPEEKTRTLESFSETDQQQMQKTLQAFERMPVEQRAICVRSFEKFATLSPREQHQFLANAERWNRMSREERQQWRDLVSQVPDWPPLPPDAATSPVTNMN